MAIDESESILDAAAAALRRPEWPAVPPRFGAVPAGPEATPSPIESLVAGRVRASRWTCELTPERVAAWLERGDARSRTIVINALDADLAAPLQLYWLLDRAEAFARMATALAATKVARVVVAVPSDVPTRWRNACRAFTPARVNPAYPAGNWRLAARAAGVDWRHSLVLDVVATIDLLGDVDVRPIAVVGDGEIAYRLARRGTRVQDALAFPEPVDAIAGPRLRGRRVPADATIGDGELVFHPASHEGPERSPCVRCGWCVAACPTRCDPVELMRLATSSEAHVTPRRAHNAGLDACVDCGLCTAVCPSRLPLHGYIGALRHLPAAVSR